MMVSERRVDNPGSCEKWYINHANLTFVWGTQASQVVYEEQAERRKTDVTDSKVTQTTQQQQRLSKIRSRLCLLVNRDVFKKNACARNLVSWGLKHMYTKIKKWFKTTLQTDISTITPVFFILKCNLRVVGDGVVWHSPRLTKLTHSTTTHETSQVVNVRLSAKK